MDVVNIQTSTQTVLTRVKTVAIAPNEGLRNALFDGAVAKTPLNISSPKAAPKPAVYGTGGTLPTTPRTPLKLPANGYNRPVSSRVSGILTKVYGVEPSVVPAIPAAGAVATSSLATATAVGVSELVALAIINGDNNPAKVMGWIRGQYGIGKHAYKLGAASTAFKFMNWDANKIAAVLRMLTPQQASQLIGEAARLGAGLQEGERFGPKDIMDGMAAVLKSMGLNANGKTVVERPKFTPPKQPLDKVGFGQRKGKNTGLVPAKPKPTQFVPNLPELPKLPNYKPVLVVPKLPVVIVPKNPKVVTPKKDLPSKVLPNTALPKGGKVAAPFVKGLELDPLVDVNGRDVNGKKRSVKKRKIDTNTKLPMRNSGSGGESRENDVTGKPNKSLETSETSSLSPEWRKVRDEWGVTAENIAAYKHIRNQNNYLHRPSLEEEITKINNLVERDPYFKILDNKNTVKKEILDFVVMKGLSPERALYQYGCSDLNWIAKKIGLSEADKNMFVEKMKSLSIEERSQFGRSILEQMPLINLLFERDGYYSGLESSNKKMHVFLSAKHNAVPAAEVLDFLINTDVVRSRVKYLTKKLKLDTRERNQLDRLFRICEIQDTYVSPMIERFLLENQTQNILPSVGNSGVVALTTTGDALSDIEVISMGGHDIKSLAKYLRSKGY